MMVAVLAVMLAGCDKYDDSELQRRVGELEKSMQQLLNYQTLLQKLAAGNTVTAYTTTSDGYKLTFSDGNSIEFNAQGPKGDPLTWDDLTQAQKDALKGAQGENGKTPKFKIENETWKVSYDDGKTWSDVGSAIDRSLIMDIKPNAAGDTLLIILADGTIIPVFYGEKERYTITVGGGRKCFSCFEKEEWLKDMRLEIPYTMTGDIKSADDVKLTYMTTIPFKYSGVSFIPSDAKSGVIRVSLPEYDYEESEDVGWYGYMDDDRTLNASWTGGWLEIMAFFPDGTTGYHKMYIASCFIELDPDYDTLVTAYDWSKHIPYIDVPSNETTANYYIRMGSVTNSAAPFDGDLFVSLTPSKYFEWNHSSGSSFVRISFGQSELVSDPNSPTIHALKIPCVIGCPKNNTGSARTETIEIKRKRIGQSSTTVFRIRFDQAK